MPWFDCGGRLQRCDGHHKRIADLSLETVRAIGAEDRQNKMPDGELRLGATLYPGIIQGIHQGLLDHDAIADLRRMPVDASTIVAGHRVVAIVDVKQDGCFDNHACKPPESPALSAAIDSG